MLRNLWIPAAEFNEHLISTKLVSSGVVFFDGQSDHSIVSMLSKLGMPVKHPDSDDVGVTTIERKLDSSEVGLGDRGFSSRFLYPHTDRSILDDPPEILALWCSNQAGSGGETVLVDGVLLYSILETQYPHILEGLENSDNFVFRYGDQFKTKAIFEKISHERRRLRFRFDDQVFVNDRVWAQMDTLSSVIDNLSISIRLRTNQGYIINNTQWLHGRKAFVGARTCKRLLLHAFEPLKSELGSFAITKTAIPLDASQSRLSA